MSENWKAIKGYEGLYEVSSEGNVRNVMSGHIFSHHKTDNKRPYEMVTLSLNGVKKTYLTHRLVAAAFIPNPDELPEVNHKNEVKTDNRVENLEWCTRQYNLNYGTCRERQIKTFKSRYKKENHLNFGRHFTLEERQHMSESHKGYVWSDESKKKLSQSTKGKAKPIDAKWNPHNKTKVICEETGVIYMSMKDASDDMNISIASICMNCVGKKKTAKGFHFKKIYT